MNASPMPPRRGASTVFHQASPGGFVRISRRRGERFPGAAAERKNAHQRRRPGPATGSRAVLHRRSPVRVHRRYAGRARPSRTLHRRSPARSPGPIRSPNTTTGMTRSTSVLSTPAQRAPARKTWPGIPRHPPRRLRRERSGRWIVVDDDSNDKTKILPGRNKVLLTASYQSITMPCRKLAAPASTMSQARLEAGIRERFGDGLDLCAVEHGCVRDRGRRSRAGDGAGGGEPPRCRDRRGRSPLRRWRPGRGGRPGFMPHDRSFPAPVTSPVPAGNAAENPARDRPARDAPRPGATDRPARDAPLPRATSRR